MWFPVMKGTERIMEANLKANLESEVSRCGSFILSQLSGDAVPALPFSCGVLPCLHISLSTLFSGVGVVLNGISSLISSSENTLLVYMKAASFLVHFMESLKYCIIPGWWWL